MNYMQKKENKNIYDNTLLSATRPNNKTLTVNAANQSLKTGLKQKMKVKIYDQNNNYFIERSAAYALGLINTRAIMINDNNDLIALPADAHNKLRNNHDIEIEYIKEMKKPKLKAYFDGNNYYIDKSAAYALKMIENEEFFASEDQFYTITVDIIN